MSAVSEPEFNCVFVSYSKKDGDFAENFAKKLEQKLNQQFGANTITVWMDKRLKIGTDWRRQIQQRLNSTALVVVILSPDSIKSPWVLYEWHCSLLIQQTEPYLVHFRKCEDQELSRFMDYQLDSSLTVSQDDDEAKQVWDTKKNEIDEILEGIASSLKNFPMLREQYTILTRRGEDSEMQKNAAYELGAVPDGLRLAAANYLIEALQFWLTHETMYGYVGASIATALGRLGKKKAIPILAELMVAQTGQDDVLAPVKTALTRLSVEEPK